MKKVLSILVLVGTVSLSANAGCVVRARAVVPVPVVTVHYRAVSGRRVLVVPAAVRPGHVVIINGQRCVVKKRKNGRVKVMFPGGRVVWINAIYR
ncbi:MAG: hypothetical protein GXO70_03785 [Acidobacteria bacterium]|nr:hypothetical protein [Acidobacteriota bacterium]